MVSIILTPVFCQLLSNCSVFSTVIVGLSGSATSTKRKMSLGLLEQIYTGWIFVSDF